jgi:hypothetical protein
VTETGHSGELLEGDGDPMRGLKTDLGARIVIAGHGFVQNLARGHYELAVDQPVQLRVAVAFDKLAMAV